MDRRPELHAVVEVDSLPERLWVPLPPKPWPGFVRLSGSTPVEHVALLVAVVSSYGANSEEPATSVEALLNNFPQILPGGIAVVSSDSVIMPGCCCGLDGWPEWRKVLTEGLSPWTGHDPSPVVEVVGDEIRVWSEGGMSGKRNDEQPIVFERALFAEALGQVSKDLVAFLGPLRSWLNDHGGECAEEFVVRFADSFVRG